jgi:signal transduction histidine kinase
MFSQRLSVQWEAFIIRIILPTLLCVALFVSAIFILFIPAIEKNSMDHKREMIRELTNSAWNILAKFEHDEREGRLTREEAQRQAVEQIRNMHYGQQMAEYFWINDMHPRLVIHPYRTDLIGKDLRDYADPVGKLVFVEFVDVVKRNGSGYVDYMWPSRENEALILPKVSYVKGFSPWGWIIGTGIYVDSIRAEVEIITREVIVVCMIILLIMGLLFFIVIRTSFIAHQQQLMVERELKETLSNLSLQEKMASLGRLSTTVAHEINNPLSGILSYARLSTKYLKAGEITQQTLDAVRENLSFIASEAKRCGDIAKNLLVFARRKTGRIRAERLNEIIEVSTKVMGHTAKLKGMEMHTVLDAGDDDVECDAGALQQIIVALVANAVESSSAGGKILIATDYHARDHVKIMVKDYGEGIRPEVMPHIFEPFFSTRDSDKSLGLGLSVVYGIVKNHYGEIVVDSWPREGAMFTITLPRKHPSTRPLTL